MNIQLSEGWKHPSSRTTALATFVSYRLFAVSENKTLCHPASVDSLSTSAGTEDHVSMGGFAARKALQVVRNVEKVCLYYLLLLILHELWGHP